MSGVLLIVLASTAWAVDTLIRYPLLFGGISAYKIVFTEHFILTLFFLPFIAKHYKDLWNAKVSHIFYFLIIGGVGSALATLSFTKAFALINPSLVILLQKLQPIVAIVLARFILREPIKREFLIWASLCLIGGTLISYKDLAPVFTSIKLDSSLFDQQNIVGYALTLIAVIGWGSSTVFGKKLSQENYSEKQIMAGRFFFGLTFLIPMMGQGQYPLVSGGQVWGKIFLMVMISGLLGMYLYYQGLKKIPARLCALAEMFFPFCAIAVNWVFLDATLSPIQLLGGAFLLAGSTIIQWRHY